jgi:ABC-type transport system substrate-binding protein
MAQGGATSSTGPAPTPVPTQIPFFEIVTPTPLPPGGDPPEGTLTIVTPFVTPAFGLPFNNGPPGDQFVKFSMNALLNRDLSNNTEPGLAESWTLDPDKGTLTFKLRKGVQFHDGWGEVTSADVKWSIENGSQAGTSWRRGGDFTGVSKIDTPDDHTMVLHLDPTDFFLILDSVNNALTFPLPVASKNYVEAVGEDAAALNWIGSGAWQHVETSTNEHLKFNAVADHYFKPPDFEELVVREVPETAVQLAMMRTGEADIMVVRGTFVREAKQSGVKVVTGIGGSWRWILLGGQHLPSRALDDVGDNFNPTSGEFNPDASPWVADPNDPEDVERAWKVRKALNLAVNRQEIVEEVYEGGSVPMTAPGFYRNTAWEDPTWEPYPYDPVGAKALLDEALAGTKWEGGFNIKFHIQTGNQPRMDAAEAVARWWEENLGLTVDRLPEPRSVTRPLQVSRLMGTSEPEVYTSGNGARLEPWIAASIALSTTDSLNLAESELIDSFYAKAATSFDLAERQEAAKVLGAHMFDNYLGVFLNIEVPAYAIGPRVSNYTNRFGADWNYPEFAEKAR